MRRFVTSILAVLAVALAGCGAAASSAGDFEGSERDVAEAIEDIQAAAERQNTSKLCEELFTDRFADRIRAGAESCVAEVGSAIDDADELELDVTAVTVDGTAAEATVRNEHEQRTDQGTLRMIKEGSQWKLDEIELAGASAGS